LGLTGLSPSSDALEVDWVDGCGCNESHTETKDEAM
jgi:hypothetical protein